MKITLPAKAPSSSTPRIFSKAISESVQHLTGKKKASSEQKNQQEGERGVGKWTDEGNKSQQKQS